MKTPPFAALTLVALIAPGCFDPESALGTTDEGMTSTGPGSADSEPMAGDTTVATSQGASDTSSAVDDTVGAMGGTTSGSGSGSDSETDAGGGGSTETGDSGTTAEPEVCAPTESCSPVAPAGWTGPAVTYIGAEAIPACPDTAPNLVVDAGFGLDAPAAQCSCGCGAASGWDCSIDVTEAGNNCGDLVFNPDTFTIGLNACQAISTNDDAFVSSGPHLDLTNAACNPIAGETIPAASWNSHVAVCEPDAAASCQDGTCLPDGGEAFAETCIYTGGITECPAGPYQAQTVVYSSFTDTRACSTCSCGDPTGTCTGQVVYQSGCGPGLIGVWATDTPPGCQALPTNPGGIRFNGSTNLACEGQGGDPGGSVTPLGPVTLCCLGDA